MKHLRKQPDIPATTVQGDPICTPEGEQHVFTFVKFLRGQTTDPKMTKTMAGVLAGERIRRSVDLSEGVWIPIETEDYKLLKDAVESPTNGYVPEIAHNLVPYMKAVTEAVDEIPPSDKSEKP